MTKAEFLARAANAYDAGLITPDRMRLMSAWLDVVMREGHSRVCDFAAAVGVDRQSQWKYVADFWGDPDAGELGRLLAKSRIHSDGYIHTLANDADGMALIQLAAIFSHPCQQCAVSPDAWWTRPGFCRHKGEVKS